MFSRQLRADTLRVRTPSFLSKLPPLPEKRVARVVCPPRHTPNPLLLVASDAVAAWIRPRVDAFAPGELWAVTLDKACTILGAYRLTRTHLAPVPGVTAHLLRFCDADGACRIVLVDNDIGGAGTLSGEVLTLTTDLCALCKAIGVDILDHLVFDVRMKYTSLRKRGFFDSHGWWNSTVYPTANELENQRLRRERMIHRRRRGGLLPRKKATSGPARPLPGAVANQAAIWVRPRLQGARATDLWVVALDNDDCICGAFHAGTPDSATTAALVGATLVHARHLGSLRVVLVQGRPPTAAPPSGPSGWAARLSQAMQSVGLDVIDHILVDPGQDDCLNR